MKEDQNQRNKSVENENPKFMWEGPSWLGSSFREVQNYLEQGQKGTILKLNGEMMS